MSGTITNEEELINAPTINLLPGAYNFDLLQTLQETLLTKVAILISTNREMTSFKKGFRNGLPDNYIFQSYHDNLSHANLKKVKEKAKEIISRLPLPLPFKEKILKIVEPITVEIETWMNDHNEILFPAFDVQKYFHWKSEGIIDRQKTLNILLNLEELPLSCRFKLACLYCKEDDSTHFWNKMSKAEKESFNSKKFCDCSILAYWQAQFNLKRRDLRLNNYIGRKKFFFKTFITNVSTLHYLWGMFRKRYCLYHREEGDFLKTHLQRSYMYPDIVRFYLTDLDSEHQAYLSAWLTGEFGKVFLNWPYQSKFLDIQEFYNSSYLKPLFNHILREKIIPKCEDYNYLELMKKFWERIPECDRTLLEEQFYFKAILFALAQENTELLTKEWLEQMDIEMKREFETRGR